MLKDPNTCEIFLSAFILFFHHSWGYNFLLHFWNLYPILRILKKITLRAYVFLKLQTAKDVVIHMYKNPNFRTLFDSQYVQGSQTLVNSLWQHFYLISWSLLATKFFVPFLKSWSHFKNFEKKDSICMYPHSICIPETTDCERGT